MNLITTDKTNNEINYKTFNEQLINIICKDNFQDNSYN